MRKVALNIIPIRISMSLKSYDIFCLLCSIWYDIDATSFSPCIYGVKEFVEPVEASILIKLIAAGCKTLEK